MPVTVSNAPNQTLLLVSYSGTYGVADALDVLEQFETTEAFATAPKILVDLSRVEAIEITPLERLNLAERLLAAVSAKPTYLALFSSRPTGLALATQMRGTWHRSQNVIALATDCVDDLSIFFELPPKRILSTLQT